MIEGDSIEVTNEDLLYRYVKEKMQKQIYFFGFEPMEMHCKSTYPTNAF